MRLLHIIPVLFLALTLTGCFHARVSTGATPSNTVVDRPFASSWINGLIPPSELNVAQECPNGVALVETQHSFVNQLVTMLTFGIYSPMTIRVTCAAGGTASLDSGVKAVSVGSQDDVVAAFQQAADLAVSSGELVYVQFLASVE
jgi:hypothetical protein